MDNYEIKNPAPLWYKIVLGLWAPVSLVGGGLVAFRILDSSPSQTALIGVVANLVQVVLLGLLLNEGLKFYSAKQLFKRFLVAFLLMAIIPVIFMVVDTGGEVSPGVLALIALLAVSIPQIIYVGFYSLARKIFKSLPYIALAISVVIQTFIFFLFIQFLGN